MMAVPLKNTIKIFNQQNWNLIKKINRNSWNSILDLYIYTENVEFHTRSWTKEITLASAL